VVSAMFRLKLVSSVNWIREMTLVQVKSFR
jgi:hypothetical protein